MTVIRQLIKHVDNFDRAQTYTTTPTGDFGWTLTDTSAAGAPTALNLTDDGGAAKILLANDTEVENMCLSQGDVLSYDIRLLDYVWFIAKVGSIGATTVLTLGVGSARADDEDAVAVAAWFKMEGATSTSLIVLETDDATTDNNDKASGMSLSTTYKKMLIDFTFGLTDVRFYGDGARVGAGTTFDMSAVATGQNVQLLMQLEKGATAGTPSVTVTQVGVQFRTADGA